MTTNKLNIAFNTDSERKGSEEDCANFELSLILCHFFGINYCFILLSAAVYKFKLINNST